MLYQNAMHCTEIRCAATSCRTIGLQGPPRRVEGKGERSDANSQLPQNKRKQSVMTAFFVYFVIPKILPNPSFAKEGLAVSKCDALHRNSVRSNFLPNDRLARAPTASGRERRAQRCQFSAPTKQTKAVSDDCFFRLSPCSNLTNKTATSMVAVLYSNTFYHYYSPKCASQKVTTCSV